MKLNSYKNILGIFSVVFLILLMATVSATYTRSLPQYSTSSFTTTSSTVGGDTSSIDQKICSNTQDFILQINPFECTPTVVTSDLLEEQNVPVFCKVTAMKINPLIDVNAIRYITLKGDSQSGISSVQFYPLRAALQSSSLDTTSAVMNDVGYAVIVLKQNKNETAMPDFVSGNVTAVLKYDIENAFGIGESTFYLPQISDAEWTNTMNKYGFWDGRGYIRADNIDDNGAKITIYADQYFATSGYFSKEGKTYDKRKVTTINLEQGETSNGIYISGLENCLGNLKVQLLGMYSADTRARLVVGNEVVEIAEGEKFLNDKCVISDIDKKGVSNNVKISCKEDDGSNTFYLRITPKINLEIDGVKKSYEIGDYLYRDESSGKSVYLGYVGSYSNSNNNNDLYVYLVASPTYSAILSDEDITSVATIASRLNPDQYERNALTKGISEVLGGIALSTKWAVYGDGLTAVGYNAPETVHGKTVKILGFSDGENSVLNDNNKDYDKAIADHDKIISNFPTEISSDFNQGFGELASYQKIILARDSQQKKDMIKFCNDFMDSYPNSTLSVSECSNDYVVSNSGANTQEVLINNEVSLITLTDVSEPSFADYNGGFELTSPTGEKVSFSLTKNGIYKIASSTDSTNSNLQYSGTIQMTELTDTSAKVLVVFENKNLADSTKDALTSNEWNLNKDTSRTIGKGYSLELTDSNLKKYAKVKIKPDIDYTSSEANFIYNISIEKRAISLSPDKAREKIEMLNRTLKDWQKVSDTLGTTVKSLKTACIGTSATLLVKNFIENSNGEGFARQEVMKGTGGWNEICAQKVANGEYDSPDACFFANADQIDKEVTTYQNIVLNQNSEIKSLEAEHSITSVLGEKVVDTSAFVNEYTPTVQSKLKSLYPTSIVNPLNSAESISTSEIINLLSADNFKNGYYSVDDLRSIELYVEALKVDANDASAKLRLYSILKEIKSSSSVLEQKTTFLSKYGFDSGEGTLGSTKKLTEISFSKLKTFGQVKSKFVTSDISMNPISDSESVYLYKDLSDSSEYLIVLDNDNSVSRTYDIVNGVLRTEIRGKNPLGLKFVKYDSKSYNNKYLSATLKYYETAPYKGLPSVVPIDIDKGWYAATKFSTSSSSETAAYDASGRVNSFYLCNVGQNGLEEFNSDSRDDICQLINTGTGQDYDQFAGLESGEASQLVEKAVSAIEEASKKYESGLSNVRIGGTTLKVGSPTVSTPDYQCTDFMSPTECKVLFNVCDPVLCPSSRCDFGGEYPVTNVVQTGIIGSIALCAPNYKEGIYMPVCLTGLQAGLDNLISISKSYRDCLQTSLDTGETVGVCDEIRSVYMCEFFWEQAVPLAKLGIPKLLEVLLGQNVRGGGEYMTLSNAWTNLDDSVDYFKNYYASESFKAFKLRSLETAGSTVCKSFVSITYPNGASLLDDMTDPDSPTQFSANFEETSFTTVTNPPLSHYKVYYNIYAGKDTGVYYKVYLRGSSTSSFYQDTSSKKTVAYGYIGVGEYASETKDFTEASGYTELCVMVNDQEECGFQSVSTSFASTYIKDQYLASQANATDIETEDECVSGTASWYNLLNANVQTTASDLEDPAIYEQGIVRVCATNNPGAGTDTSEAESRWTQVGYCDKSSGMKCWLDSNSVKNVIESTYTEDEVLQSTTNNYLSILQSEGDYITDFSSVIGELNNFNTQGKYNETIAKVDNDLLDRAFYNKQKAYLYYVRGNAFAKLAIKYFNEKKTIADAERAKADIATDKTSEEIISNLDVQFEFTSSYSSPIFEFQDGTAKNNYYYVFYNSAWHFSDNYQLESSWVNVNTFDVSTGQNIDDNTLAFIQKLKDKDYSGGIVLLITRTFANDEGGVADTDLVTTDGSVSLDNEGVYKINTQDVHNYYFKFSNSKWQWSPDNQNFYTGYDPNRNYFPTTSQSLTAETVPDSVILVIESLSVKTLYEGAIFLFDNAEKLISVVSYGDKILDVAISKIGTDTLRTNADGTYAYDNVCAHFVTTVLLEAGVQINGLACGSGLGDSTEYLNKLFTQNSDYFKEITASQYATGLQPGDIIFFGDYDTNAVGVKVKDEFQHVVIFEKYSDTSPGEINVQIIHDPGSTDTTKYLVARKSYTVSSSWFISKVYRVYGANSALGSDGTTTTTGSSSETETVTNTGKWNLDSAIIEMQSKTPSTLDIVSTLGKPTGDSLSTFYTELESSKVINSNEKSLFTENTIYKDATSQQLMVSSIDYSLNALLLKKQIRDLCNDKFDYTCTLKLIDQRNKENVEKDLGNKYSSNTKNKVFVDELYLNKLITQDEYNSIIGEGLFTLEKSMIEVKTILQTKKAIEIPTDLVDLCSQKIFVDEYDALNDIAQKNNFNLNSVCNSNFIVTNNHVTSLTLTNLGISSITSLIYLQKLEFLILTQNKISSVDSLKMISSLQKVDLSNNDLTDISSLKDLNNLDYLNVNNNCLPADYNYNTFTDKLGDQLIKDGNPRSDC